jgi:hypothetical protein
MHNGNILYKLHSILSILKSTVFWMTFFYQMFKLQSEDPIWNPGSNILDNKYKDLDLN